MCTGVLIAVASITWRRNVPVLIYVNTVLNVMTQEHVEVNGRFALTEKSS